jgi:cytidylate kinase
VRIIAIDGPAGAGKSTIARALATRLGLRYLDTGAQYRAAAVAALRRGVDLADVEKVAKVATEIDLVVSEASVTIDGEDATAAIRTPEASQAASRVAANPGVRAEMRRRQWEWADVHGGGVIEGRDIGSVVFPEAELKVYLTASAEVRAQRRHQETGEPVEAVLAAMVERDARDAGRAHDPLVEAHDAVVVDTSNKPVEWIVDEIVAKLHGGTS